MQRGNWAKHALDRYEMLKRWKHLANTIAIACTKILGDNCLEVHVVGSAAEDRLTVLSDIDIAIVTGNPEHKTIETIVAIKKKAEELGLPPETPIDIKILTQKELQELVEKKVYRKTVRVF